MNDRPQMGLPEAKRPGRGAGLAPRVALLAASLALTLLGMEAGLRLFSQVAPGLTERDPLVGQRYLRSFEADVFMPEAGRRVALRFNDVGFRGPCRPQEKPPGVRRLAILGDSMIASLAVDEPQTMVCQLERLLNESPAGASWEVFNFGVNGASPGQNLVLYREVVSRFQPDVVLATFFVGNDLADNCSRLSANPRIYFDVDEAGELRQEPFGIRRTRISQFLNRYSRLYVWQKTALNRARHTVCQQSGKLEPGEWVYSSEPPADVAHAWTITARVFETFQREVEARGGRFAVVVIPCAPQIYRDVFAAVAARAGQSGDSFDPDYPDRRVAEICRAAGIPCFSMLEDFRRAAPSASSGVRQEWLFCDGTGHFNAAGDALAARAIQRFATGDETHQVAHGPLIRTVR